MGTYAEAEAAREAGDLEGAAASYRRLLEQDPTHRKARNRLIRVLRRRSGELRSSDPVAAVEMLREASSLDPSRRELRARYRQALRRMIVSAIRSDDRARATELVELARADEASDPDDPLISSRMASLVSELPLTPLRRSLGDEDGATRWLVVVDRGVDEELLPALLDDIGPADVYTFAPRSNQRLPAAKPLSRVGAFGLRGYDRIYEETGSAVDELIGVLRSHLPDRFSHPAGLDLLQLLSFRIEDQLVHRAREVIGLQAAIRARTHGLVLLVGGEGSLIAVARAIHEVDPIELPVWELRCGRNLERVDTVPRPVDLDLPRAAAEPSRPPRLKEHEPASRVLPRRSRFVDWLRRARHSTKCALIALPDSRHVASVASIAARIDERVEVVAVPLRGRSKQTDAYAPYDRLLRERPNTRITTSCCPGPQPRTSELAPIVYAALSGPALESLTLAGFRLGEVARVRLEALLSSRLALYAELAIRIDAFLATERPDVLLVSPDRLPEARIACALARRRRIPTVFPQLFLISPSPRNKPLQTDIACVLDDSQAQVFEEWCDATPDRIIRTGFARFDPILDRREAGLPAPPGDGTVLLALQPLAMSYNRQLTELLAGSVREAGGRLIVKLHPRDTEGNFTECRELVAEWMPKRGTVLWKEDIYEQILGADVVVSTFSNVILESALLDRPAICANLSGEPLPVPFVEQGVAFGADGPDEVRRCIARVVRDAAFREEIRAGSAAYFSANPHLLEGRAADRIAAIVESLAAGSKVS